MSIQVYDTYDSDDSPASSLDLVIRTRRLCMSFVGDELRARCRRMWQHRHDCFPLFPCLNCSALDK
jgi:hypothetical protein